MLCWCSFKGFFVCFSLACQWYNIPLMILFPSFFALFIVTEYYETPQEILISCILSISVLTMMSSTAATVISAGFPREKLEFLRHYSVFNIVSCKYIPPHSIVYITYTWYITSPMGLTHFERMCELFFCFTAPYFIICHMYV